MDGWTAYKEHWHKNFEIAGVNGVYIDMPDEATPFWTYSIYRKGMGNDTVCEPIPEEIAGNVESMQAYVEMIVRMS